MRIGRRPSLMSHAQEVQASSLHTHQMAPHQHDETRRYRARSKKIIVDDRFGSRVRLTTAAEVRLSPRTVRQFGHACSRTLGELPSLNCIAECGSHVRRIQELFAMVVSRTKTDFVNLSAAWSAEAERWMGAHQATTTISCSSG
jgi:hypothetical protein